ncbi:MAG: hypothetical protein HRF50_15445 [Phycisphaerae bacterium]|jgi:hypothetical protein
MIRRWTVLISCVAFVLHGGASALSAAQSAQTAPASQGAKEPTRLAIHVNPLVDMHYYFRALAEQRDEAAIPEPFRGAVAALRTFYSVTGPQVGSAMIEPVMMTCATAAELHDAVDKFPGRIQRRDGAPVPSRAPCRELSRAYMDVEQAFRTDIWPAHAKAIEAAQASLDRTLLPRADECLRFVLTSLAMLDPGIEIPVTLVAEAPFPQGFTYRRRNAGPACFVGVQDLEGSLLSEVVLHEAIHALDVATDGQPTVPVQLFEKLLAAGNRRGGPAHRDVPHTLIFVQAAETIRRVVDPAHQDYGDVRGYYAKVPEAVAAVRERWRECLDGKLPREQAVADIASAYKPPQTASSPATSAPHEP